MAASAKARRRAVQEFKRGAILDAASRVVATEGPHRATVRAIAEEAGYSAGAIYAYYRAKEEIYGDILADSLSQAAQAARGAIADAASPETRLSGSVGAYYAYYRDHPQEFELGLYLFQGPRRGRLSAERERLINGRLIAALQAIANAVTELGALSPEDASLETVAALSQMTGILTLEISGRLKLLGFDGEALITHYVDAAIARLKARP